LRCRDNYELARLRILMARNWRFAVRETTLHFCSTLPDCRDEKLTGTRWAYIKPSNALKITGVFDTRGRQLRCEGVNGRLVTREPAAFVRFVADVDDLEDWPAYVFEALVRDLAWRIAPLIQGGARATMERILPLADRALAEAISADVEPMSHDGDNRFARRDDEYRR